MFAEIDEAECRELLAATTVGRVAFVSSRGLRLLPVNFRTDGAGVFFRTSRSNVLAELVDHVDEVVFETDHHDDLFQQGWSVVVAGTAQAAADDERAAMVTRGLDAWAAGDRPLVIKIVPSTITGRRVSAH